MKLPKLWGKTSSDDKAWPAELGKGRRNKKPPSRRQLLALRPVRNPALEWYEEDGHVVLHIKQVKTWKSRLLNIFFPLPQDRHVTLDAIGTDVWQMLDGNITIGRISKALAAKYKLTPREAELSVQQFFKELGRRGYIGFWVEQPPTTENQTVENNDSKESAKSDPKPRSNRKV